MTSSHDETISIPRTPRNCAAEQLLMSATSSCRPEVESALRRTLRRQLEDFAERIDLPHLERDQAIATLQALGLDELLVVDAVLQHLLRRQRYVYLIWRVLTRIAERLMMGRLQYGALNIATDQRRWPVEAREECLDAVVYITLAQISGQRDYSARALDLLLEIGGEP